MPSTRRDFLRTAAVTGSAAALAPRLRAGFGRPPEKLNLLILGGTGFLGPHIVETALERGHSMTLFNRGKTNTHLFPDLEKLRGDREKNDLKALEGRSWDAVIDTSGYVPGHVKASAGLVAGHCRHYTFVSSISVYPDFLKANDEYDELQAVDPEVVAGITTIRGSLPHYGAMKALCEQAAEEAMPGRVANIRPGLIVGPGDSTDRFNYWPARVDRGGEVLSPGDPAMPVQVIDARDLAAWIVKVIEDGTVGVFNATGPRGRLTMSEILYGCKVVIGSDCSFTWVPDEFLQEQQVGPWMELPLWIPGKVEERGLTPIDRALDKGLRFRPLGDTIRDTLAWLKARPADYRWRAGLDPEKERKVLEAWHARSVEAEEVEAEEPEAGAGG